MTKPFQGIRGGNQVETPGAMASSVALNTTVKAVRLVNSGANICYVRVGIGPQTATTADTPVLPYTELVISKEERANTLSHISASGTTLHIQPGSGGAKRVNTRSLVSQYWENLTYANWENFATLTWENWE